MCVGLCVCPSVCEGVCFLWFGVRALAQDERSHALCCKCKIADEMWTSKQIQHNRIDESKLTCHACSIACKDIGTSAKDDKLYPCAGCGEKRGRAKFSKTDIDNYGRPNRTKALFCVECVGREKRLLAALRQKNAVKCNKKCNGPGHVDICKAYPHWTGHNVGVTRDDLRFLKIRSKTIF